MSAPSHESFRQLVPHPGGANFGAGASAPFVGASIDAYLREVRDLTLDEIRIRIPPDTSHTAGLYGVMLDYPMRPAKALRPALCMSVCLALGGSREAALPSAAALELFHNALLVHDDVEDGSLIRRHEPTLHTVYGVPIAVNVGDGMLVRSFEHLFDNIPVLGLGAALRIFQLVLRSARESAEGQMIELEWIRSRRWDVQDRDYLRMVHKKTGWYSFIAPVGVGAVAAGATDAVRAAFTRFALLLGISFQIHDDLLSLKNTGTFGKDTLGDLWEGKYTLPLLDTLRSLPASEQREALDILARPRSLRDLRGSARTSAPSKTALLAKIFEGIEDLSSGERALLEAALGADPAEREEAQVRRLHELVVGRNGASLDHARAIAVRHARRASKALDAALAGAQASVHTQFLRELVTFVIHRES
ncbi:MAG: polyprenyl synthetase family protein [Polyangia bacterium]